MSKVDPKGPNEDQIAAWNADLGEKFVRYQHALDKMLGPFGDAAIDRLGLKPGEYVLDIGCGCGETTIDIARRVGAKGEVVGADISEIMLAKAEDGAAHAELTNVFFEHADVQTSSLHPRTFDAAFSRFGVMFFADPKKAFANVCEALHEGGRLAFCCWQAMDKNPWLNMQMEAVAPLFPPQEPVGLDAPGPASFADPTRVEGILSAAGFLDFKAEEFSRDIVIGSTKDLDDAAEFALQMGPVSFLLAQVEAGEAERKQAFEAVRDAFAAHHTSDGVILQASAWIVSAHAP